MPDALGLSERMLATYFKSYVDTYWESTSLRSLCAQNMVSLCVRMAIVIGTQHEGVRYGSMLKKAVG